MNNIDDIVAAHRAYCQSMLGMPWSRLYDGEYEAIIAAAQKAFAQERQDVLNCINLYGDEVLHKALDSIGWPDDYRKEQ